MPTLENRESCALVIVGALLISEGTSLPTVTRSVIDEFAVCIRGTSEELLNSGKDTLGDCGVAKMCVLETAKSMGADEGRRIHGSLDKVGVIVDPSEDFVTTEARGSSSVLTISTALKSSFKPSESGELAVFSGLEGRGSAPLSMSTMLTPRPGIESLSAGSSC